MSKKSEGMEKIEKRLEEEQRRIQEEYERDQRNASQFPALTKLILQGTAMSEQRVVKHKDGKKYRVTIHALGEEEILDALDQVGLEAHELGSPLKTKANIRFQHAICKMSIKNGNEDLKPEELGLGLLFGECSRLTQRILEMSGFPTSKAEQASQASTVDSFRQVQ